MMKTILQKYADLLVHYCLQLSEGDQLYIRTTLLAEPLVREVYRSATAAGAHVETAFEFQGKGRIFFEEASEHQLRHVSPFYRQAMETFEAFLHIRAPYDLREDQGADPEKSRIYQEAHQEVSNTYFRRTATRELRRNLCQFPTQASANEAGMSPEEYESFVYGACKLYDDDPVASWLEVRRRQQHIVDHLNRCESVHYLGDGVDIRFSTKGRTWINSDGQTNMPSGEVYTSPVEDSVNGVIHFGYPALYMGQEVEGVTLWVKDGFVERWEAKQGAAFLDQIFKLEGSRRFGEAAIGTNYDIGRFTKNILFDEKIGGTVHMALGQSYLQTGGKNQSAIHWDMIADMKQDGEIFADGEKIYEKGRFLLNS